MEVEMRYYKNYDIDLIALAAAGYPVSVMMRDAVVAYANGKPLHYLIDKPIEADFNILKTMRTRLHFPNSDARTIYLLKHLKFRSRNMFCKAVLRNALIQQNLTIFFADGSEQLLTPMQSINLSEKDLKGFSGVIPISRIDKDKSEEQITLTSDIGMPPLPVMPTIPSFSSESGPVRRDLPPIVAPADVSHLTQAQTQFIREQAAVLSQTQINDIPVQDASANASCVAVQKSENKEEKPMFNTEADSKVFDALDRLMDGDF